MTGSRPDVNPEIPTPQSLSIPRESSYSSQSVGYSVLPSSWQPIPIPRSFSQFPLGQAPKDITEQYDDYVSNQEHVDEEDAMEEA